MASCLSFTIILSYDFRDIKLTFPKFQVEVELSHALEDMMGSFGMGLEV